jgi:hypothetical protein
MQNPANSNRQGLVVYAKNKKRVSASYRQTLKPTFFVRSLEAVRIAAESTGGVLKPSEAAWQYNGAVILDGCDPEGNVVQFRQHDA